MIIIFDFLIIIFCFLSFFIGVYFGKKFKKEKTLVKKAKIISKKDKTAQKRIVKEMQNFLNYNGDKQEDIL